MSENTKLTKSQLRQIGEQASARWLTVSQVAAYIGYSSTTSVYAKMKEDLIPEPSYHLGKDSPRWDKFLIDDAMGGVA